MLKSSTGQRIHKWARKLSSSSINSTGNEPSKSGHRQTKNEEEILRKYYQEEDDFLSEIEQIRKSLTSPTDSAATSAGVAPVTWSLGEEEPGTKSLIRSRSPGVLMTGSRVSRKLARLQQRKQALLASFTGECISPQTDLLGSFCHLMNYVVHLRRDNRRLRKQVTCLAEMRKIEQLKFELLHSNCTCRSTHTNNEAPLDPSVANEDAGGSATPSEPVPHSQSAIPAAPTSIKVHSPCTSQRNTSLESSYTENKEATNVPPPRLKTPTTSATCTRREIASLSIRVTTADSNHCSSTTTTATQSSNASSASIASTMKSSKIPKAKITPCRLEVPRNHCTTSEIRDGAQECLATPPPPTTPTDFQRDRMVASSCSADISSAASSTAHASPRPARSYRYGLPAAHNKTEKGTNRLSPQPAPVIKASTRSNRGSDSEQSDQVFSEVCFPDSRESPTPQDRHSGASLRRPSAKHSTNQHSVESRKPDSSQPVSPTQSNASQISLIDRLGGIKKRLTASMSRSEYADRRMSALEQGTSLDKTAESTTSQSTVVGAVRRAFVKKRKRKISESDSVASSDTGGLPYKMIELPSSAGSPNNGRASEAMFQAMHSSLTPEYIRKMTEWQQKRMRRATSSNERRTDRRIEVPNAAQDGSSALSTLPRIKEPSEESEMSKSQRRSVSMNSDLDNRNVSKAKYLHHDDVSSFISSNPSLNVSRLSVSDDSVFVTADQATVEGSVKEGSNGTQGAPALISQIVTLQDKNSALFRQLMDKTQQYEKITEQLTSLEREVRVLKGQYNLDSTIEHIVAEHTTPSHVPVNLLTDLETHLRHLEDELRVVKNEAYNAQQEALDAHSKEQVCAQTSLDQVENMKKNYFDLLQAVQNQVPYRQEIQYKLDALPPLEMLYTYAMGLIRKVRQLRTQAMERQCTASRLDIELVQTQCCLLLSHAQMERQKLELSSLGARKACIQRCHSYHGQELIDRLVNVKLNFFLPFKLHGCRSSKVLESSRQSMLDPLLDQEPSEAELLRMFERMTTRSHVTYDDVSQGGNLSPPKHIYESPHASRPGQGQGAARQMQMQPRMSPAQPRQMYTSHGHTIDTQPNRPQHGSPLAHMRNARRQQSRPVSMIENPVQTPPSIRKPYTPKFDGRRMTPVVQHQKLIDGDIIRSVGPYPSASSNIGQVRALTAVFEPDQDRDRSSRPQSRLSQMENTMLNQMVPAPSHLYRPIVPSSFGWSGAGNSQPAIQRRVMPPAPHKPLHPTIDSDGSRSYDSPPSMTPPWRRQSGTSYQTRAQQSLGKAPTATSESSTTPSPHYESLHSSRLAATPVGDHRLQINPEPSNSISQLQPSPRERRRRQFLFSEQQSRAQCAANPSTAHSNAKVELPVSTRDNATDKKPSWISRLTHHAKTKK